MPNLQLSMDDYIAYTLMSLKRRLLVEGADENRLFNRLFDNFDKERIKVDVDDASCLIGFSPPIGNREKVEMVCSQIRGTRFEDKLVGFVDREFRGFQWNSKMEDEYRYHRVDGRLIWTRGHSIENYYLDTKTLEIPIATLSTTSYYREALALFKKNFEIIVRLACAASLVGLEIGNFQIIRNAITWEVFRLNNDELNFEFALLQSALEQGGIQRKESKYIIDRLTYWISIVSRADFDIVRWMCHGHIGLSLIWASYYRMVFEVSKSNGNTNPRREVSHSINVRDEIRFNVCGAKWIERALGNDDIFPYEVLRMLNLVNT